MRLSGGSPLAVEDLPVHPGDQHLLVVGTVEDADLAARGQLPGVPPQVVVPEFRRDGSLKLDTLTPCGFTPLITCRIVPSLPAASRACSTTRTP